MTIDAVVRQRLKEKSDEVLGRQLDAMRRYHVRQMVGFIVPSLDTALSAARSTQGTVLFEPREFQGRRAVVSDRWATK